MDAALKKLFAKLDEFGERLKSLEELEERLTALDTNGKLGEIKRTMAEVAANSQIVVNTVESHGDTIGKLEKTLTRLDLRCPLMKPDTSELPAVTERTKLKDE